MSQNGNDKQEVLPALEALEQSAGRQADIISADNGYMSGDNLQALAQSPMDVYIATDKGEKKHARSLEESDRKLVKADFIYDEDSDSFTCPGGQQLVVIKADSKRTHYQGSATLCDACQYKSRCCQSAKGAARTITTDDKEPLRQEMNAKMAREESKAIYKERKVIVEPVFGQIKNTGFHGFSLRGKDKVAGEFSLVCSVHNIKKMVRALTTGWVPPEIEHKVIHCAI